MVSDFGMVSRMTDFGTVVSLNTVKGLQNFSDDASLALKLAVIKMNRAHKIHAEIYFELFLRPSLISR
jgi:hypothetical protein